jgi:hypothetical protein
MEATTLEFKSLTLGGIRFLVEEYNQEKHDHIGHPLYQFG